MTLGDIIYNYRKEHGLSMDAFADMSGLSKAYISLLEKNKHPKTGKTITPSIKAIKQVSDAIGLDFNDVIGIIDSEVVINSTKDNIFNKYDNIYPIELKKFPLLGSIACGEPIFCDEDRESYIEAGVDIHADFCIKAKGDSMVNARILDGDIVFIRKQSVVDNGEIAAVIIDNEVTLKRVTYYKGKNILILKPENPNYKDLIYMGDELDRIRVLGKAIAFQSDAK